MTHRKRSAKSVLFSLILIALVVSFLPGCLEVSPDSGGNGTGTADGTSTPIPRPTLEISLSLDNSERNRLMATTTFRNTGGAPLDGVHGNVSLIKGNETVRTDPISIGQIDSQSQVKITQFYNVERNAQYYLLLELNTALGPVTKRYKLDI